MAGVAINFTPSRNSRRFFIVIIHDNKKQREFLDREVCVTVGLSSEVCLLPTSNKICDFCLFFGVKCIYF